MRFKSGSNSNNDKNIDINIDLPNTVHEDDKNLVKNNKNNDMLNHRLINVHSIVVNNKAAHDRDVVNLMTLEDKLIHYLRNNTDNDINNNIISCTRTDFNNDSLVNKKFVINNINNDTILRTNKNNDIGNNIITCSKTQFNNDSDLINKKFLIDNIDNTTLLRTNKDNNINYHNIFCYRNEFDNNYNHINKKYFIDILDNNTILRNNNNNNINNNIITCTRTQFKSDDSLVNKKFVIHNIDNNTIIRTNKNNDIGNNVISCSKIQFDNDNNLVNKKYVVNNINNSTIMRLNQSFENYLDINVNGISHKIQRYIKNTLTYKTNYIVSNSGYDLLGNIWSLEVKKFAADNYFKCVNSHNNLTPNTGPSTLPPSESNYMYIETSGNNHSDDEDNFCRWSTYHFHNISRVSFRYNRYSSGNDKWMGAFSIEVLKDDNTWDYVYLLEKNDDYTLNNEWKSANINIPFKNFGIKFNYTNIKTSQCDMAFSNITLEYAT